MTLLVAKRDYRKQKRQPLRRDASLVLDAARSPVRCVIWDISNSGARLAIANQATEMPRSFTLLLTKDATVRRICEVVWTDRRFIGVKFVSKRTTPRLVAQRPDEV